MPRKRYQKKAMSPPPLIDERKQDSHRAKVRIGVAAALLVTAIGILTILNQRRAEQPLDAQEAEQTTEQESISSVDMETSSAIPAEDPTAPLQLAADAATEPPPPPIPGSLPNAVTSHGSKPAAGPELSEESAGINPSVPYVASAGQALGKPAMSAAAVQSPAQSSALQARPVSLQPKAFEVQLGVFTDIDNAKQLQARLAQHGIPSHTETRVQIGPFKSRDEADRAREKLKALGVSAVVLGK
jgi:DedD protein